MTYRWLSEFRGCAGRVKAADTGYPIDEEANA